MCGDFFVAASDGTGSTSVGGPEFESYGLAWSPDGKDLAFGGRFEGGPMGVYLIANDGSAVRRISQSEDMDGFVNVQWSADGTRLVTFAGRAGGEGTDIWVIPADGSGDVNLTEGSGGGFLPAWSADSAWIAFRDASVVYVVPSTGGDIRVLGTGESIMWSPDATALALGGYGSLRLVDPATGEPIAEIADIGEIGTWQRVAS
jgi:Tol biopolymer transport system component